MTTDNTTPTPLIIDNNDNRFWLTTDQTNLSATSNIITDFSSLEEDTIGLVNASLDFFESSELY